MSGRFLVVPGWGGSSKHHWQTHLEASLDGASRVEMRDWMTPHAPQWIATLEKRIAEGPPAIVIGHSLGCIAIAHAVARGAKLRGALLVAPPDCDHLDDADRLAGFGPAPKMTLPFPSLLVASRNDPYASLEWSRSIAHYWGSEFVDAGELGHINADSGIGGWPEGQALLGRLVATAAERAHAPAPLETRRSVVELPDKGDRGTAGATP